MKNPDDISKVNLSRIETLLFQIDRAAKGNPEIQELVTQGLEIVKEERRKLDDIRDLAFKLANKL